MLRHLGAQSEIELLLYFFNQTTSLELTTLKEAIDHHSNHRVRMRSHAIVLSCRHYSIPQLINILGYNLLLARPLGNKGVAFFDPPRSVRPQILTTEDVLHLAELLQTEPRQLKEVHTWETVNKFILN